ncbi:hypothetical protein ACEWY4_007233 [Coilia grayii]|uniref:Uncharacterized protein n=1 Tax=Coilia grayii TaxID=363190 RepID=A0ABD1KGA5_9TELE
MPVQTLNELDQLLRSNFGRPKPRHGLQLLFWFAHDFIKIYSNRMVATSHPAGGVFGFHLFHNRSDDDSPLLPLQNLDYYEVGNLNERNAWQLPEYVTEKYTGHQDNSNTDRIIVAMNNLNVHKVYVTRHSNLKQFLRGDTYCISFGLIKIIRKMNLKTFLSEMRTQEHSVVQESAAVDMPYMPTKNSSDCKYSLMAILLILLLIYLLFKLN